MPRARNIKYSFFQNEDLAVLSPHARLLFIGLWTLADKEGRLEDRPMRIKAQLFPFESVDVGKLLDELADSPGRFLMRYEVGGVGRFIEILKFTQHQHCHNREPESLIPPYSSESPEKPGLAPDKPQTSTGLARLKSESLNLKSENGCLDFFEQFWNAYPKKTGKKPCEAIWKRKGLDKQADQILSALEQHKKAPQWVKDNGQYIPNPQTWLNQERWTDEVTPTPNPTAPMASNEPVKETWSQKESKRLNALMAEHTHFRDTFTGDMLAVEDIREDRNGFWWRNKPLETRDLIGYTPQEAPTDANE